MFTIAIVGAGLAVVLLTSIIKQVQWTDKTKNLVATVLSVIAAGILFVAGVDFSALAAIDLVGLITSVYGSSQLIYNFILSGTGLDRKLASIGGQGNTDTKLDDLPNKP